VLKRILLAENETISRKYLSGWLLGSGYDVTEAKDGAEALDFLDTQRFDLVLSDIRMPRVNGIAVITHLRSISPWVPFIIMSAYPSDADGILGGTIMRKPVLLDLLEAKIRSLFVH
jgi:CheY-like chemotaxis protein